MLGSQQGVDHQVNLQSYQLVDIGQSRQSMEGLFQVLQWRLDNAITPVEFRAIFSEWLKSNGH